MVPPQEEIVRHQSTLMLPDEYQVMFQVENTHWWYRALRVWLQAVVHSHISPQGCILDIGCGTGANLALLKFLGYRPLGIDLSVSGLQFASRREDIKGRLCCASAETLPFVSGRFDGIISLDVLNLLSEKQEEAALLEIKRVLRRGGALILNLPAYEWLRGEHDQAVSTQRRYTASMLEKKLVRAGFRVARMEYRCMMFLPAMALLRRFFRRKRANVIMAKSDLTISNPGLINSLFSIFAREEELLGRLIRRPFGTSVCAVAISL